MNTINHLLEEATHLPLDQRLTLANRLLMLDEKESTSVFEHAWDIEIRDRIARYDRNEASSRSAGEVFRNLDRLF